MTSELPRWVDDYVGLPFAERGRTREGCDCYGLVRLVLMERIGVELPSFSDLGEGPDKVAQADMIDAKRRLMPWRSVPPNAVAPLDVVEIEDLYKTNSGAWNSAATHAGIVVAPCWMLHTRRNTDARLERYDIPPVANAVRQFWRWGGERNG